VTEYFIGNLLTGRRLQTLPVMTGPWSDQIHVAETITVTVDLNDADVRDLDLDSSAAPAQSFLAVRENGRIVAAGPIWTSVYDRPKRTLTLRAAGMASLFNHRLILPVLAASIGVDQWTVPDPLDSTKTIPNPALATVLNGISLGTMAKRLVQQARTWTGGNVPIEFQPDEAAARTKTYDAVNFKPVWEACTDIMNMDDGPEINFQPLDTDDLLGVKWLMETGTVAEPLITSTSIVDWDLTAKESPISDFQITTDATKMGSLAWQTGGAQNSTVVVSRAYDPTLVSAGYPLMELSDSSHSTVDRQDTLDDYATADVIAGRRAVEVWSFSVKAYPTDQLGNPAGPRVGDYQVGDFCNIHIDAFDPKELTGDPFKHAGGDFPMRIIGISGDEKGIDLKIDLAPALVG